MITGKLRLVGGEVSLELVRRNEGDKVNLESDAWQEFWGDAKAYGLKTNFVEGVDENCIELSIQKKEVKKK